MSVISYKSIEEFRIIVPIKQAITRGLFKCFKHVSHTVSYQWSTLPWRKAVMVLD